MGRGRLFDSIVAPFLYALLRICSQIVRPTGTAQTFNLVASQLVANQSTFPYPMSYHSIHKIQQPIWMMIVIPARNA